MHARPFGCAAGAGTITFDGTSLSIEDAWKIAAGEADVAIAPEAVKLLEGIHKLVTRRPHRSRARPCAQEAP